MGKMRKKYKKITHQIIESIRYARLLEELTATKQMIKELEDKRNVLNSNKKKKENDAQIKRIELVISEIENTYKSKTYIILLNDNLNKYLNSLSNSEYYEMLKYNIAINVILDSSVEYHHSEQFLQNISTMLFQDKNMIKTIQRKLSDIYFKFNEQNPIDRTTEITKNVPIKMNMALKLLKKKIKILPNLAVIQGFLIVIDKGNNFIKKKRQIKKLKTLSDTEFEYILTTTLLRLTYAKEVLSEVENKKYFASELNKINAVRITILKDFYVSVKP